MNNILKYSLIGGAALVGGVVVFRIVSPAPTPKNSIAQVLDSATGLLGAIKGKAVAAIKPAPTSPTALRDVAAAGVAAPPTNYYDPHQDAAVSDGRGLAKVSGIAPRPTANLTRADKARVGLVAAYPFAARAKTAAA